MKTKRKLSHKRKKPSKKYNEKYNYGANKLFRWESGEWNKDEKAIGHK